MRIMREADVIAVEPLLDLGEQRARRLRGDRARGVGAEFFLMERDAGEKDRLAVEQDPVAVDRDRAEADPVFPDIRARGDRDVVEPRRIGRRSEEHTSELQSLMRISYAVFCLRKKTENNY